MKAFKRYQAAAPFDIKTVKHDDLKLKQQKSQSELSLRLIEVLEEEKQIKPQEETPIVTGKFLEEVFNKNNHLLKCEAELTSDDNFQPSED